MRLLTTQISTTANKDKLNFVNEPINQNEYYKIVTVSVVTEMVGSLIGERLFPNWEVDFNFYRVRLTMSM